jgi:hypothetical protein
MGSVLAELQNAEGEEWSWWGVSVIREIRSRGSRSDVRLTVFYSFVIHVWRFSHVSYRFRRAALAFEDSSCSRQLLR